MKRIRLNHRAALFILLLAVLFYFFMGILPSRKLSSPMTEEDQSGGNSVIRLDWYIDSASIPEDTVWAGEPVLAQITRKTGVEPQLQIPQKNKTEMIDLMIASNNFPDLISLDVDDTYIYKLIRLKKLVPFDLAIDKYAPAFKNEIDGELWTDTAYDDGMLYGLPGSFIPRRIYSAKKGMGIYTYNVRKDFYTSLGSPDMSTPETFVDALRSFALKFPKIGAQKSIPLSVFGMNSDQMVILERSFGIKEYYEDKNGDLLIKYKNPAYMDLIRFLNGLYREGLLDRFAFIKKQEQITDDLEKGRIFSIPADYRTLKQANELLLAGKESTEYIAVEPMKAVPDVSFPGRNRYGTTMTMIPAASNQQEAAIKLIRYLWGREAYNELKTEEGGNQRSLFPVLTYPYDGYEFGGEMQGQALQTCLLADKYFDTAITYFRGMDPDYALPIGRNKSKMEDIIRRDFPVSVMAESEYISAATFKNMLLKLEQAGLEKLELYWTDRHRLNQ